MTTRRCWMPMERPMRMWGYLSTSVAIVRLWKKVGEK
jgi:hypothetical protein